MPIAGHASAFSTRRGVRENPMSTATPTPAHMSWRRNRS